MQVEDALAIASHMFSCDLKQPVIETDSIKSLIAEICEWHQHSNEEGKESYVKFLIGPTGIGKTFSLIWVYASLIDMETVLLDGKNFPLPSKGTVYFYDFNSFKVTDIELFARFIMLLKYKCCALVCASSGNILCTPDLSQLARKFILSFYQNFDKILMKPFKDDHAKQLASRFVPSNLIDYVVKKSSGIPGLIAIKAATQMEYDSLFFEKITMEWNRVRDAICAQEVRFLPSIKLLVAAQFNTNILATKMELSTVSTLLPISCHLIYIDSTGVPVLYVTESKSVLKDTLSSFFKRTTQGMPPTTDAESAIGSCMEFRVLHHFNNMNIELQQVLSGSTNSMFTTLKLPFFQNRTDKLPDAFQPDFVYLLPEATAGIDCMAILKSVKMEGGQKLDNVLLLVQITIKKDDHGTKIRSSISNVPLKFFEKKTASNDVPHVVIYLYIAPFCDFTVSAGMKEACNVIDSIHFNMTKKDKQWYYSQPTMDASLAILETYYELKTLLKPM